MIHHMLVETSHLEENHQITTTTTVETNQHQQKLQASQTSQTTTTVETTQNQKSQKSHQRSQTTNIKWCMTHSLMTNILSFFCMTLKSKNLNLPKFKII